MMVMVGRRMIRHVVSIDLVIVIISGFVMIVVTEIESDVCEQHVLMFAMAHDQMLNCTNGAGHCRLSENEHEGDAQHRSSLPEQGAYSGFHHPRLPLPHPAGNQLQPRRCCVLVTVLAASLVMQRDKN
jgi:hypothetical protein